MSERDTADSEPKTSWRQDLHTASRESGPAGNKRLTTSIGLVLFVLLGVEALTTLRLRSYLPIITTAAPNSGRSASGSR